MASLLTQAPIEVDENLALKRCREMQDHDGNNASEGNDATVPGANSDNSPSRWAADCSYAIESEEPGTPVTGREGNDTLPNLTMSDSSVSSCSDDCDSDDIDSGSEGTYYSPTPSQILSRGSLKDEGRNCFFDEPAAKQLVTKSPSAARLLGSPSSPAIPNFLRWDREEPASVLTLPEKASVGKEGVVIENSSERERRRLLRLKMQERAKNQENEWDSCLGGF
ncbi:Hypothetical predicted protein [Olea europaea subsp. europaea]|uniref:Uncharacterized protein n=1 Tax=Olea europaea subsp. europaea TaxID=158383 RepID=A0A8S0VP22_OLEEU|nr:Hypothetical predicted protein [Olea europaea subsp. europaea]